MSGCNPKQKYWQNRETANIWVTDSSVGRAPYVYPEVVSSNPTQVNKMLFNPKNCFIYLNTTFISSNFLLWLRFYIVAPETIFLISWVFRFILVNFFLIPFNTSAYYCFNLALVLIFQIKYFSRYLWKLCWGL